MSQSASEMNVFCAEECPLPLHAMNLLPNLFPSGSLRVSRGGQHVGWNRMTTWETLLTPSTVFTFSARARLECRGGFLLTRRLRAGLFVVVTNDVCYLSIVPFLRSCFLERFRVRTSPKAIQPTPFRKDPIQHVPMRCPVESVYLYSECCGIASSPPMVFAT